MKRINLIEIIGLFAATVALIFLCSCMTKLRDAETEPRSEPSENVTTVELDTSYIIEENMHDTKTATEPQTTESPVYTCIEFPEETSASIPETPTEAPIETIPIVDGKILDVPLDYEIQLYTHTICDEYGIPFELAMAVMYVESGFDSNAISAHGDYGLMQVSSVNHGWLSAELGLTDFLDPYQNIRAGIHILAQKIRESDGEFTTALMKYNRGDAVALEQMANGIFSTDYTDKVLSKYYEYILEG